MHRSDNSLYFMFIEPDASKKSSEPVEDELTASLADAMKAAETGRSDYSDPSCNGTFRPSGGYRGFHVAEDGTRSDNFDYRLPNGLITNSLSLHYVRFYRSAIPNTEMEKLRQLHMFMEGKKCSWKSAVKMEAS